MDERRNRLMRTLSAAMITATESRVGAEHGLLISIGIGPGAPIRSTTYATNITFQSETWFASGTVAAVSPGAEGEDRAQIEVVDMDLAFTNLIGAHGWSGHELIVYHVSGPASAVTDADPVRLFQGVTDEPTDNFQTMQLTAAETGAIDQFSPRVLTDEICHHMPAPGTVIQWNGVKYIVKRSDFS